MLKTKYLLLCASLLFTSTVFTACDDDDDSSSSTSSTSEKLLKSKTETIYDVNDGVVDKTKADTFFSNYTYNPEGKLIGYKSSKGTTSFTYNGDSLISESIGYRHIIKRAKIGNSGHIEYETTIDSATSGGDIYIDTSFYSYDRYMVNINIKRYSDYGSNNQTCNKTIGTYTYENGCLMTENYNYGENNNQKYSYYYTDNNTKTPIPNKSSFVNADEEFNPTESMYGKHSTNLPVKQVGNDSYGEYTTYYTWTLDSDGYPVKCEQKTYDSSNILSDYNITTYTWQ